MPSAAPFDEMGGAGVRARLLQSGGGRIDRAEVRRRASAAMARGLPSFHSCAPAARTWAIVGGGPSIAYSLEAIRTLKRQGANIVSVNKSHDWLLERGIAPCAKRLLMDGIVEEKVHHG